VNRDVEFRESGFTSAAVRLGWLNGRPRGAKYLEVKARAVAASSQGCLSNIRTEIPISREDQSKPETEAKRDPGSK
jgi:hypothetical protein